MTIMTLGIAGGLFALLALVHFVVDWIFQTHAEAMVKHNNPWVRAKHCLIYTLGFIPLLYFFDYSWLQWLIGLNILFWSHFCIDTYYFTFLWMKHVRHPPSFDKMYLDETTRQMVKDDKKAFVEFITTPIGCILMIVIDQLSHMLFFAPIIYMAIS